MARIPRFVLPGHPQHIIIRGNNREAIFYADEDYRFYLTKLRDACKKTRLPIARLRINDESRTLAYNAQW